MDHFFQQQLLQGDVFCYENCPVNQSAFVPYICRPWGAGSEVGVGSSSMEEHPPNMNKRMIELVKRSFTVRIETQEPDSKRCYQHMMSERLRRQKERNGYLALHSVLPHDTKKDKNSIMLMAAKQIQELEMYKEMLKIRNDEIEERLAASGIGNVESTQIRIEVANPTSRVDPMMDVLKCMKNLGSKTRSIRSQFSDKELVAVMEIETEVFPPLFISCNFPAMVFFTGQILMQRMTHGIPVRVIISCSLLVSTGRIGNEDAIFHDPPIFTSLYLFQA